MPLYPRRSLWTSWSLEIWGSASTRRLRRFPPPPNGHRRCRCMRQGTSAASPNIHSYPHGSPQHTFVDNVDDDGGSDGGSDDGSAVDSDDLTRDITGSIRAQVRTHASDVVR